MNMRNSLLFAGTLLAITFSACQVTDHSEENPGGITTGDMEIPASGFDKTDPSQLAILTFDTTAMDMGKVAEGVQVERVYGFVNSGKRDLILTDVRGSCGCTVGKEWPRTPVAPGARGAITVAFDSQGRPGMQHKTITVVANTQPQTTVLTLSGEVVAAPDVQ